MVDVIRCVVADDVFCLEMSAVANVKPAGDCRSFCRVEPNDPIGFIEHRGNKVPVFDLPDLLGLPYEPKESGHYVVVIDHPIQSYGLRVENVSRVIRLVQENVLPLPVPLEHTGRLFRGIVDFTRDQRMPQDMRSPYHLPGISEPKQIRINRRRSQHQMQLLLNPATLLPGHETKPDPPIPFEYLQKRYASVPSLARTGSGRQLVTFPAGVFGDRQVLIGLSISQIVEISKPLLTVQVPGVHPALFGFSHWRNCPVPVIDLQTSLQHEVPAEPVTHLLIVRDHHGAGLLGLPVAGRVQSLRLPIEHRACALPDPSWKSYVLGVFELEERLLVLPRLDTLSGLPLPPVSA
jgi:chemotaxis signal transduction protein